MITTLALCLYRGAQNYIVKHLDNSGHKLLSHADIENLFKTEQNSRLLKILKSAVVDHERVDGISYHTRYPFDLNHDRFRKSAIALGLKDRKYSFDEMKEAVAILDTLSSPEQPGHTQIIAWDSLGNIVHDIPKIFEGLESKVVASYGSIRGSIGSANFLRKNLRTPNHDNAKQLILNGAEKATWIYSRAAFAYVACKGEELNKDLDTLNLTPRIREMVSSVRTGYFFTHSDLSEGLVFLGMFDHMKSHDCWPKTPHEQIKDSLPANDIISAVGSIYTQGYRDLSLARMAGLLKTS